MKLIYQGLGLVALLSTAGILPAQQAPTAFLKTNINPGRAGNNLAPVQDAEARELLARAWTRVTTSVGP